MRNIHQEANTLDKIGDPYLASGQRDEAREVWQEAHRLYSAHGYDDDAARVRRKLDDLDAQSRE